MDIKEIINLRYAMPDASLDKLRQCLTKPVLIAAQEYQEGKIYYRNPSKEKNNI